MANHRIRNWLQSPWWGLAAFAVSLGALFVSAIDSEVVKRLMFSPRMQAANIQFGGGDSASQRFWKNFPFHGFLISNSGWESAKNVRIVFQMDAGQEIALTSLREVTIGRDTLGNFIQTTVRIDDFPPGDLEVIWITGPELGVPKLPSRARGLSADGPLPRLAVVRYDGGTVRPAPEPIYLPFETRGSDTLALRQFIERSDSLARIRK